MLLESIIVLGYLHDYGKQNKTSGAGLENEFQMYFFFISLNVYLVIKNISLKEYLRS